MGLFRGSAPDDLGPDERGKLRPCPKTPNAVNSEDPDPARRVDPLPYPRGRRAEADSRLRALLDRTPRLSATAWHDEWVHAEARSAVLGFVDDVEFRFDDAAGAIQLRSQSRLGSYDFGVNRRRCECLLADWKKLPS